MTITTFWRDILLTVLFASAVAICLMRSKRENQEDTQEGIITHNDDTKKEEEEDEKVCWICMCNEADGELPIRDCSCRNTSGWAHFSCIIRYAKNKSEDEDTSEAVRFKAWSSCPNCKQAYQNKLALDLVRELQRFADEKYSECTMLNRIRLVQALTVQVDAITLALRESIRPLDEGINAANKILSATKDMKRLIESEEVVHPESKTIFNEYMKEIMSEKETYAYSKLMFLYSQKLNKEGKERAFYYCGLLRKKYVEKGDEAGVRAMDVFKNTLEEEDGGYMDENLMKVLQDEYNRLVKTKGEHHVGSIEFAEALAVSFYRNHRGIEAERLLSKYSIISRRVLGAEHDQTKTIVELLDRIKERRVYIEDDIFEALRYKDGGDTCVVEGPLYIPMESEPFSVYTMNDLVPGDELAEVEVKSYVPKLICGTPVFCQRLINAPHLNGKLGEVRLFDEKKDRYMIHFEDESLKPVSVKRINVRIAFELPEV